MNEIYGLLLACKRNGGEPTYKTFDNGVDMDRLCRVAEHEGFVASIDRRYPRSLTVRAR